MNSVKRGEDGSGMILALFVLVLLTGMGAALLFLSNSELKMSRANLDSKRAYQFAESGLEDARQTLFNTNGEGPFSDDLEDAGGVDLEIDFEIDDLQITFDAAGLPTGLSGYDDDDPLRDLTSFGNSAASGAYAAFLTNDPIEGVSTVVDVNRRVMLTAVGFGPRRSTEIVQAIIEPYRPIYAAPPAAITMLGPAPSFNNGPSHAQAHNGNDCGGAGVPGLYAPIVGTVSGSANAQIQGDMQRPANFDSGTFSGTGTVGNLADPTDPILVGSTLGTIDPGWSNCEALRSMVLEMYDWADYYCNADVSTCTISGLNPGEIAFIDGDFTVPGNISTVATLLVTGVLTFRGNSEWNGLMMAIGEGRILRSGGGGGTPSGAAVMANIDPTPAGPSVDKGDWCSTSPDGFGQARYLTTGGGNSEVDYCSVHINQANPIRSYKIVEFLQR